MNNAYRRHPKGAMVLATLVVVAIIAVLYMMIIKAILPVGSGGGGPSVKQDRPWRLDDLIVPNNGLVDMPESPKLVIDDGFELKAAVSRNGSDRGFAVLQFDSNGEVSGKWLCDYTHETREYSFISTYAGNIVVDKEYSDDTGSDESLLFFIVKGKYTQRKYHPDFGEQLTNGIIYLTGWVETNKSLKGILTITTDDITDKDKWAASYELAVPAK
jgi:hypothetical protein